MGKLRSILAKYSVVTPRMGGTSGASAGSAFNMDHLRADLREAGRRNTSFAWICIGMLMVLFLINCGLVLKFSDHLDRIEGMSSIIGVSLAGAVFATIKFWKVKVLCDVLLVLAAYMKPDEIQQAMKTLLRG